MVNHKWYQYYTYHHLNISHGMVKTSPNNTDQLPTEADGFRPCPLVIPAIPFLGTPLHLGGVIGSKGDTLETMTCGNQSRRHEILEGEHCHITRRHAAGLRGGVHL